MENDACVTPSNATGAQIARRGSSLGMARLGWRLPQRSRVSRLSCKIARLPGRIVGAHRADAAAGSTGSRNPLL